MFQVVTISRTPVVFSHTEDGWAYRLKFVSPGFSRAYPTYDEARESALWRVQDHEEVTSHPGPYCGCEMCQTRIP
jgi:hypothetical protein